MSNVIRLIKELERVYRERNKLLIDSGLEDFTFSNDEIEKFVAEAAEKEITKGINKIVKDSGL